MCFQGSYPLVPARKGQLIADSSYYGLDARLEFSDTPRGFSLEPNMGSVSCPYLVEPQVVHAQGGESITVFGSNFANSKFLRCRIGDDVVPASFVSYNEVKCITPFSNRKACAAHVQVANGRVYSQQDTKVVYSERSLSLDGLDKYVVVQDLCEDLKKASGLTIAMWIKPSNGTLTSQLLGVPPFGVAKQMPLGEVSGLSWTYVGKWIRFITLPLLTLTASFSFEYWIESATNIPHMTVC